MNPPNFQSTNQTAVASRVRIPYRSANVLPPGIPPLNLFRLWAHSPSTLPHSISLGTACHLSTSLTPYHRSLIALLCAQYHSCTYLLTQHLPLARSLSITETQIAALLANDITADMWTNGEKALLAFVEAVLEGSEVEEGVWEDARRCFSERALVEVVTLQGFYYSLARIATVFRVDLESSPRTS